MRKQNNILYVAVSTLLLLLPMEMSAIKVDMGTITIKVGEEYSVDASYGYEKSQTGYWEKSNSTFVFASQGTKSCKIRGNQVGTGTLSYWGSVMDYSYNQIDWEPYWTVNVVEQPIVKVTSITLSETKLILKVKQEETLTAMVWPSDATDKSVAWSIDDSSIAEVSQWGVVKAKREGNATITCRANDGSGVSATCNVKIEGELPKPDEKAIKQVAAGSKYTMILMANGSLWACGRNDYGQLGDGTTTNSSTPKHVMDDVAYVAAGSGHTMIVKTDGTLWACGRNDCGQLGDGSKIDCNTPQQIMSDVMNVATGSWHTMILKTDGSLWACGSNYYGQLGDGTTKDRNAPKMIMTGVASVSAGTSHTMIIKTDGSLWACGYNNCKQLAGAKLQANNGERTVTPEQVMSGVRFVAAGDGCTMIIKVDKTLWACGDGSHGRLGTGSTSTRNDLEQVMAGVEKVSVDSHTMILKTDGTLWACGWNYCGQLGDGTNTDRSTPKKIMDEVADVAAGSSHTIIVKKDGTLMAIGSNDYGQLGDGTVTNRNTPVTIDLPGTMVTDITLDETSVTLLVGDTKQLNATISPNSAINKTVSWSSSDTTVATVSNGLVVAKARGTAVITCTSNGDSGVSATCEVIVTSPLVAEINSTNFPDENFRNWILARDYGKDAILSEDEIKSVTSIDVAGTSDNPGKIKSLKGIEYFTALDRLNCEYNQLTSLDVSKNTALTRLNCYNNKLNSLDLSSNTALIFINCYGNGISTIDVSKNINLETLACQANNLTTLDVSNNKKINWLIIHHNKIKGSAMDNLIASLPVNTTEEKYTFFVVSDDDVLSGIQLEPEGNVCTKAQVAALKAKGWTATKNGGEYEGSENPSLSIGTGTEADPFNSAAANEFANSLGANTPTEQVYYVKGKVVSIKEQFGTQYGNATFYISDDGTTANQFYIYKAKYLGNKKYAGEDLKLNVGDEVVVCGKLVNYIGTLPGTVQDEAYVVSINGTKGSTYERGDVNGDGVVNIADLMMLVNILTAK